MSVQYEITNDPQLLGQYFRIREHCFREELNLPNFDGSEDAWDRRSHLLIARDEERCVAGVRITGRYPLLKGELPIEEEGLELKRALPHIPVAQSACCQWSRLVVDPEYREWDFFAQFGQAIIRFSELLGFGYSVAVTGMNQARFYKRLYSSMGYRFEILQGIAVPAEEGFDGLPHLLSVGYLAAANERMARRVLPQVA